MSDILDIFSGDILKIRMYQTFIVLTVRKGIRKLNDHHPSGSSSDPHRAHRLSLCYWKWLRIVLLLTLSKSLFMELTKWICKKKQKKFIFKFDINTIYFFLKILDILGKKQILCCNCVARTSVRQITYTLSMNNQQKWQICLT